MEINHLRPDVNTQILFTGLHTFLLVLVERIWWKLSAKSCQHTSSPYWTRHTFFNTSWENCNYFKITVIITLWPVCMINRSVSELQCTGFTLVVNDSFKQCEISQFWNIQVMYLSISSLLFSLESSPTDTTPLIALRTEVSAVRNSDNQSQQPVTTSYSKRNGNLEARIYTCIQC